MNEIFLYLLKVSAGLAIISLPYLLLFRDDPNLVIKRFYLLAGIVAAWVFPFITFRKFPLVVDLTPTVFIDLDAPAAKAVQLDRVASTGGVSINWLQVLLLVYITGLGFLFLKNLFIILKWNLTWHRFRNDQGIAFIKKDQVFTLFTRIFIPGAMKDQDDLENILLHEKAHIRQLHFIDLMLIELTLLLTWFNPFSWLISRMIKENHEHLADREVLSAGANPARYRAQLMNHTLGVNVFRLGTQFNHSLTLKRFKMMKKPKKSPLGILKIALLIPAVMVTLGLTIGMTPQQKTIKGKVILADTGEPATGASIVIMYSTVGTVVDKDGTFSLHVDGNPELVVSYVGYKTFAVKASDIGNKPLKLEVETVELDLEPVTMEPQKSTTAKVSGSIWFRADDGSEANPVFVLDGKVVKVIEDLDPGTIESVNVIKDPNDPMAEKYNAKDGVILITTKKTGQDTEKKDSEAPVTWSVKNKPGSITLKNANGSDANPVYVVDGEVVEGIEDLDPESIENIFVYKDRDNEVVQKYQAKNGVIMIFTKEAAAKENGLKPFEKEGEQFYIVEDMPKFPGGLPALKTYIYSNLEYPEKEKSQGIEGEVTVRFLINEKGKAVQSEILQSSYQGFNAPALKVINDMPDWTPGKQRGKPVNVWYVISIKFPAPKS